jgi:hypothetical protein
MRQNICVTCALLASCRHTFGDKDTFGFAFAAARKLHKLHAVALPPGAALRYERSGKPWQQQGKWRFNAMMQYDHLVRSCCAVLPAGRSALQTRPASAVNDLLLLLQRMHAPSSAGACGTVVDM